MTRLIAALLLLCTVVIAARAQLPYTDAIYHQLEVSKYLFAGSAPLADWTILPMGPVLQAVQVPGQEHRFYLLTASALYRFDPYSDSLQKWDFSGAGAATLISRNSVQNQLAFAGPTGIWRCSANQLVSCQFTAFNFPHPVSSVVIDAQLNIFVGSDVLYVLPPGAGSPTVALSTSTPITSLDFCSSTNTLAVGTADKLFRFETLPGRSKPNWHFYRVAGLIDNAITSMVFDRSGTLWLGNKDAANSQSANLTFSRYGGGAGGIPYGNITYITTSSTSARPGGIWMGTTRGVMRYEAGKWRYFNGPRWLTDQAFGPGNRVVTMVAGSLFSLDAVLVITETGMSWMRFTYTNLENKASDFQKLVLPYHDRFGLTSSSSLKTWGLRSSYQLESSENDGLWTSIYLASQALRYAVTKDPAAKSEADRCLGGLELLNKVTGIKGLFARSVKQQALSPQNDQKDWVASTTMPGWIWQRDTSSDEVTGHMLAYTMYYKLVAQTPEEKMRAATLLTNCMTYVIENDFYLIDITGHRTSWGVWNPDYINDNADWYDQRGVNSLQIMAWISAAKYVASGVGLPTSIYDDAMQSLVIQHDYDINVLNTKIAVPNDDNYSDDELTFLPYYTYLMANGTSLGQPFYTGLDRIFKIVKEGRSPLWTYIYAAGVQTQLGPAGLQTKLSAQDFNNAYEALQNWPVSWINWPIDNTQRLDVIVSMYLNRKDKPDMVTFLPWDERGFYRWNADPFEFLPTGTGYELNEPSAYLLPYWMARYHNLLQ